ncbi:unnamed protein product [Vitrella brassicaformis CCMP3155]|uniref:Apple domain-containing protein n=2 Tax=Vitrella brassicaformis TaxID=1169539 RepID=A0A0G4EB72_VITBC|nr:unnamed protein product [Vitrella brassicaformis CCMP3155]|eukprot:CEL92749.1 unnamed protein product [Vitrella brassicaformis CCMP3155]
MPRWWRSADLAAFCLILVLAISCARGFEWTPALIDECLADVSVTRTTCAGLTLGSGEKVTFDPTCEIGISGCNVQGNLCCRYCGFGEYADTSCLEEVQPHCNASCYQYDFAYTYASDASSPRKLASFFLTSVGQPMAPALAACQQYCVDNSPCTHFTLSTFSGQAECKIFEIYPGDSVSRASEAGAISGRAGCTAIEQASTSEPCLPYCHTQTLIAPDYSYNDAQNVVVESILLYPQSAMGCFALCYLHNDCQYMNFIHETRECHLLKKQTGVSVTLGEAKGSIAGCLSIWCRPLINKHRGGTDIDASSWRPLVNMVVNSNALPEFSLFPNHSFGAPISEATSTANMVTGASETFWQGSSVDGSSDYFTITFSQSRYISGIELGFDKYGKDIMQPYLLAEDRTPRVIRVEYSDELNAMQEIVNVQHNDQVTLRVRFPYVLTTKLTVYLEDTHGGLPVQVYSIRVMGSHKVFFLTRQNGDCSGDRTPLGTGMSADQCRDSCAASPLCFCAVTDESSGPAGDCVATRGTGVTTRTSFVSQIKQIPFEAAMSIDMVTVSGQRALVTGDQSTHSSVFVYAATYDQHSCPTLGPEANATSPGTGQTVEVETATHYGTHTAYVSCPDRKMAFARCLMTADVSQAACEALGCCWDQEYSECYSVDPTWDVSGQYVESLSTSPQPIATLAYDEATMTFMYTLDATTATLVPRGIVVSDQPSAGEGDDGCAYILMEFASGDFLKVYQGGFVIVPANAHFTRISGTSTATHVEMGREERVYESSDEDITVTQTFTEPIVLLGIHFSQVHSRK